MLNLMHKSRFKRMNIILVNSNHLLLEAVRTLSASIHLFKRNEILLHLGISLEEFIILYQICESNCAVVINTANLNRPCNRVTLVILKAKQLRRTVQFNILRLISPLAVSAALPAGSEFDSLRILVRRLHLTRHVQVIKPCGSLLCLVKVRSTLFANKAEHRLPLHHALTHLGSNIHRVHYIVLLKRRHLNRANLRAPLLGVLAHE